MYKLVIADDDEIQLQGMCCAFPWEELDIEVAAGVDDGDKALKAVVEKQADVLLTDIKMSNMDGLKLTEQIRTLCPDTHVVIMSAYDDFQFAQKALRLGVDDYLLKPIDLNQMRETMRQIVYQKEEKKRNEQIQKKSSRLEEMVMEDEGILEETFFQNVLNQKYTRTVCSKLEEPYLRGPGQKWLVVEALFDHSEKEDEYRKILRDAGRERGFKYIHSFGHHLFCCLCDEETAEQEVSSFEEDCRNRMKGVDACVPVTFIAGPAVSELYYLSLSYEKIRQICSYQFSEGKDKNLSEKDLDKYFDQNHTVNKSLVEYLAKLVTTGYTDMLHEYVGRLKNNLRYTGSDSILMLSFSVSSILGEIRRMPQFKEEEEELDALYYRIIKQKTLDDAMELLEAELIRLTENVKENDPAGVEQSIVKACEYIEEHFSEPGLRIGDAAAYAGLSRNYFSTVFTEVTGESFTDYLIKRRMKEAQILLMNPDYKIQEIGYMTGYDNPAYFSAAFKKFTGVSVSQYKKMIKGMGNR
ncbi:response regulator [Faecalicatena orotica]|uniref:response regulator n=1 Tax=Faecalicatena orotica TaxID=1544 RepID=UPI003216F858